MRVDTMSPPWLTTLSAQRPVPGSQSVLSKYLSAAHLRYIKPRHLVFTFSPGKEHFSFLTNGGSGKQKNENTHTHTVQQRTDLNVSALSLKVRVFPRLSQLVVIYKI